MKLISIELNNFRQYYGEKNIINFDNSDITVILGINGRGKTGIFRGMMFCLYGTETIAEDDETDSKSESEIHLVNLNKLDENIGKKVEASVKVVFEHELKKYIVERKIYELKKEGTGEIIKCSNSDVKMQIIDENGNFEPDALDNEEKIESILEKILNPKLKDFFFFNGDKIESLAKTNKKSREEIKLGITKLLQIDNLETSVRVLERLLNEQKKKISAGSSMKLKENYYKQAEINEKISEKEEDLDNFITEKDSALNQFEKIKQKMKENEEVKKFLEKNDRIEQTIRDEKNKLDIIKENFKTLLKRNLSNSLILDNIEISKEKIKNKEEEIYIPTSLIEKILEEQKCICGKCIEKNTPTYEQFKNYKKMSNKENRKFYIEWLENINMYKGRNDGVLNNLETELQSIVNIKEYIQELEENRKIIKEKIKTFSATSENELKEYQEDYDSREKEIEKLSVQIEMKKIEIKNLKEELEKQKKEAIEIEKQEDKNKIEIVKKQKITDLLQMLEQIKQSYINEVKEKLSKEMFRIFKRLIDEKDKDLIGKITVDDNYEIDVRNWQDLSILQDISSGQKHIVSLSLIIALSKLACNEDNKINVPLFMDTPLGKISMENRKNIINAIPEEMEQWILLATDTELTKTEMNYLYETNKWNNLYILNKKENGKTEIQHVENIKSKLY